MVVVVVVVMVVIVVPAVVPVSVVLVPMVIVVNMPAISVPIPCIKLLSIMVRYIPTSPLIGRSCPITVMPFVVISDWIPITVYI